MNAIKVDATINEAVAHEIPALPRRKVTFEELLASRIKLPPGVGPVTLDDLERGIIEGASGRRRGKRERSRC